VWHKHIVTRKYWTTQRRYGSDGSYYDERVEKEQRVAKHESQQAFTITDETGSILVHPGRALEDMEKLVDRFERSDAPSDHVRLSIGQLNLSLPKRQRDGTIGYRYEEWVLRPGTKLFALGEASDATGTLTLDSPSMVSTKNKQTLEVESQKKQRFSVAAGAVTAVAGLTLIVADLFF
jgi:hypothetical protein